ncbi:MAG: hypothetical protein ACI80N_000001, partial [Gammaproteobacteria bacterium]
MESQNSTKCATNGATAASSYVDRDKLALDHVPLVKH